MACESVRTMAPATALDVKRVTFVSGPVPCPLPLEERAGGRKHWDSAISPSHVKSDNTKHISICIYMYDTSRERHCC